MFLSQPCANFGKQFCRYMYLYVIYMSYLSTCSKQKFLLLEYCKTHQMSSSNVNNDVVVQVLNNRNILWKKKPKLTFSEMFGLMNNFVLMIFSWRLFFNKTVYISRSLFQWYSVCRLQIHWEGRLGRMEEG